MARKYYGYKPKYEHYSTVLYDNGDQIGNEITFVYENGRCYLHHFYWGSEMDYAYNSNGFVEHTYFFNQESTKLLMLRTGTKNGKALVDEINRRFHMAGYDAVAKIREWCEAKGIRHDFNAGF